MRFNNHKSFNAATVVFSVFTMVGLVFMGVGVWSYYDDLRFKSYAVETQASITDIYSYTRRTSDGDSTEHEVYVEFTANGRTYEGRLGQYSSGMRIGQTVNIYYDPDAPNNFRTASPFLPIFFISFGSLFFFAGLIYMVVRINGKRRRKKLLADGRRVNATINDITRSNVSVNRRRGYIIICEWKDPSSGVSYLFKSESVFFMPNKILEERQISYLPVHIDNSDCRKYYVDLSRLYDNVVDLT